MTFQEDKFPALSGVAKRTNQFKAGDWYVAGLWRDELPLGLDWWMIGPLTQRSSKWYTPSWSWASANGPVGYNILTIVADEVYAVVNDVECIPAGDDMAGGIIFANLSITAPTVDLTLEYSVEDIPQAADANGYRIFARGRELGKFRPDYILS